MGLIKAAKDAIGSMMADQWREYFYCDSLNNDTLVVKGQKRVTAGRNSNTKGVDNIITNGSIIAVNEGQCMLLVDQGEITDFCADAGEFVYDSSAEPSLFYGGLGEGLKNTFSSIGKRFTFGGNAPRDQRVYFINTKEIMNNLLWNGKSHLRSGWWTKILCWIWMLPSAVMDSIPLRLRTRWYFIRKYAAMCLKAIPEQS